MIADSDTMTASLEVRDEARGGQRLERLPLPVPLEPDYFTEWQQSRPQGTRGTGDGAPPEHAPRPPA